jgi:hypothetical protein
MARSMMAHDSSRLSIHGSSLPKLMQPKQICETSIQIEPSMVYFIMVPDQLVSERYWPAFRRRPNRQTAHVAIGPRALRFVAFPPT